MLNKAVSGLIFITIIVIIYVPAGFCQERETTIIQKEEIFKLLRLFNNLENLVVEHNWALVFNSFLEPAYADTLKNGDKWKELHWIAKAFYPDFTSATAEESISRANSITTLSHLISSMKVFKQEGCSYYIILEGIRTIEFDQGKKYIPFKTDFRD